MTTAQTKTEEFVQRSAAMAAVLQLIMSAASEPSSPADLGRTPAPQAGQATALPPSSPVTVRSQTRLEQKADNIVRSMVSGNFKAVTDNYTPGLAQFVVNRRGMPTPSALGSTWQGFVNNLGPFQSIEAIHEEAGRRPEVVFVVSKFRDGNVNIEIVFGPEPARKTCNLRLQPAPQRTWPQGQQTNCL